MYVINCTTSNSLYSLAKIVSKSQQVSIILINMSTSRSLSDIAALIQHHSATLEDALKATPRPHLSFEVGSPLTLPLSPQLQNVRDELVENLDELRALVFGPMEYLLHMMVPLVSIIS